MTAQRYPLWCVNTQDPHSTGRYKGPFVRKRDALQACRESLESGETDATIRRCRRLRPSEIQGPTDAAEVMLSISDSVDSEEAWGDFDIQLCRAKQPAEIQALFVAWLDTHLILDVFVCEGDET